MKIKHDSDDSSDILSTMWGQKKRDVNVGL